MVDLLPRLDSEVREELVKAYAPRSEGPIGTALRSFAAFARAVPTRQLFITPRWRGDIAAEAHNEWTLMLWVRKLAREKSAKTKRHLKVASIEQRVSLMKGLLSHRYGFQIAGDAQRLSSYVRLMRQNDPLAGIRRKRQGMRRRHFRKLWKKHPELRQQSFHPLHQWAAATTAWHVLARGGELESVTRSDLTFHITSDGRRYARLMLRPLKKKGGARQPKLPQFIAERVGEEWEPYKALRRLAEFADERGSSPEAPLFQVSPGKPMKTAHFRTLMRRFASMLGFDPKKFGGHSARIGGATDLAASGELSEMILSAKGRWQSDIGKIYARMTRRAHLAAFELMHGARGRDLEEIFPEFVQPA